MDKRIALVSSLDALKAAHEDASKVLWELSTAAVSITAGDPIVVTPELLQRYRDAAKKAKEHAAQAQMILAELNVPMKVSKAEFFVPSK
jgi:hypothetical protein